jgi:hypothetical protein
MFGFGAAPNSDSCNKARQFNGYWGAFIMADASVSFAAAPCSRREVGIVWPSDRNPGIGHLPSVLPLNFRHIDTGYKPRNTISDINI